jgi:tetratricopeptide (TPR) repeat protein
VLDLVLLNLGRPDEAVHAARALEIYERLGDREEQGHVLNTLALVAHARWDWDEAQRMYGRAAEAYERAGSQGGIAVTACNIGEILSDRGFLVEAEQQLNRARRMWSAARERTLAAYAAALMGRVAARGGNIEEARRVGGEAAAELSSLGAGRYTEEAEAILAEAEALGGDASRALTMTATPESSSSAWLLRIRGIALARLGRLDEAMTALDRSLEIARERGALYDVAATLDVQQALGADEDGANERDSLLAQLGIERLPELELTPLTRNLWPRAAAELSA